MATSGSFALFNKRDRGFIDRKDQWDILVNDAETGEPIDLSFYNGTYFDENHVGFYFLGKPGEGYSNVGNTERWIVTLIRAESSRKKDSDASNLILKGTQGLAYVDEDGNFVQVYK